MASDDPELTVCTGDWVALRTGPEPEVVAMLPRRSAINRASADRTSHRQVLAANVDTVVIVVSLAMPIKAGRIERLLALAWNSGTRPVIALTKADVADDASLARAIVEAVAAGVDVVTTSATTGEGLGPLADAITGTAVLLGPSGAGKSTLANALLGRDLMGTNEVRGADGKGRHTTVHRQLLPLPGGGALIDTPGLRSIGIQDVTDGVEQVFADIEELAADCSFRDCAHRSEPGCAVQAAIAAGELDARRLDRYRKLLRESEWAASRGDSRKASKRTKEHKAITKEIRALYRFRDQQR